MPVTLVLDNARYQRCLLVQDVAKELGIELLFLPSYSPNLNLIERLWKFVKKEVLNSRHHQAVQKVGSGLVVSATAPDGVIEAVEDPSKRFCVGVQWHPENFYRTGEFRALFEAFVGAAGERA